MNLIEGIKLIDEFIKKTLPKTRSFYKLSKKVSKKTEATKKKRILEFIENEIYPFWKKEVQNKFWKEGEVEEKLPKDVILTYVMGVFIAGHSKKLQEHQKKIFSNTLIEITNNLDKNNEKKNKM